MYKRQILFCCLAQLTIVMSATTSSSGILTDTTPKSTVAGNCFYDGQMYNVGDIFKSSDDCNTCSCDWLGTTCTATFCPPKHSATPSGISRLPDIASKSSATTSSGSISSDFTSTSATSKTSTIISSEATYTTTTPMQCVYNGQVYNVGDTFIANDHCSICWCVSSQLICTMCPPQPSTSSTSSTISPDTTKTTTAGQCVYNGQVYNDGYNFIANDYCQSSCWCIASQMICPMCPPQISTSTTRSTISPDTSTPTTAEQCAYNGQVYNDWEDFIANYNCQSSCWCIGSQTICAMCPPQTSTAEQCVYNGQVYNDGDNFIANDYCQSSCLCMGSHMICMMCPPQTSTSPTSTISSSEATYMSSTAGQCVYNGQVYNDGDNFIANDYCQSYCWCMGSQMICTMCPPQTSTSTTSSSISPDTSTPTTPATSKTISPDISKTTTSTSVSSRLPRTTSSSTYTEKKRRRTTLPRALYTKTKKFHIDLFDTITKKPHFTIHDSREVGSKRSIIPKGNRRNNDIR